MLGYILVCLVACIILVSLVSSIVHLCSIICIHACVVDYALLMHVDVCMWSCVSGVMVVIFMHEIMLCVADMAMH